MSLVGCCIFRKPYQFAQVKDLYDRFSKNTFELLHLPLQLQLTHLRCILLNTKASHYAFLAKDLWTFCFLKLRNWDFECNKWHQYAGVLSWSYKFSSLTFLFQYIMEKINNSISDFSFHSSSIFCQQLCLFYEIMFFHFIKAIWNFLKEKTKLIYNHFLYLKFYIGIIWKTRKMLSKAAYLNWCFLKCNCSLDIEFKFS